MKKYSLILLFNIAHYFTAGAQSGYDIKLIPAELLPHANVVKRMQEKRLEIDGPGNGTLYNKYAVTILNEAGDDAAGITEEYDQFNIIKNFEGTLYDANGKKIKALKKSDVQDFSGSSESTLAGDARVKHHNFNWKIYPYTVEYEVETALKGIFYLPSWVPVDDENLAVEKSTLIVKCPADYGLRFKTFMYNKEPFVTDTKQGKQYEWSVDKLPAIEKERYQPEWYKITPSVFLAPTAFEIQHYTGTMNDWKGLGKFIYTLNAGRDQLPDNIKRQVHALTEGQSSVHEKINILYQFLQKNTHYISIQLGIGGWQTFDANYVATKAYGDCKALSNYMYSLLKEAGIKSNYAIIKSGDYNSSFMADFPSNQFDHVIVCVPLPTDTVWLECTSQTLPAGYLSAFTSNRNALLIDETGGTLVRTPVYNKNDNLQSRKITATVDADGKMTAVIHTKYRAEQQDNLHGMLNALSKEKVSERLKEAMNLPSYDITKFEYHDEKGALPAIDEAIELVANNFSTVSGRRLFLNPNVLNKSATKLPDAKDRKYDIKIAAPFTDIDSVEVTIPAGYLAESIPADITLDTKFGTYHTSITVTDNKIFYTRYSQRTEGIYPPTDAIALADFFNRIYAADRTPLAFVKKQ